MTFGEKLQTLRRERGLSQEALAEQLRVSRQAVSKWELDAARPDIDNVLALAALFEVSTDYLLLDQPPAPAERGPSMTGSTVRPTGTEVVAGGWSLTAAAAVLFFYGAAAGGAFPVEITFPWLAGCLLLVIAGVVSGYGYHRRPELSPSEKRRFRRLFCGIGWLELAPVLVALTPVFELGLQGLFGARPALIDALVLVLCWLAGGWLFTRAIRRRLPIPDDPTHR